MGNLINPIGGRLGILNSWKSTWPINFQKNKQVDFFHLSIHIRLLLQAFILKAYKMNPNHFTQDVLHGMVLKIMSNVWGFSHNNLSVYFKLFDYKISVHMLKAIPHKFYFRRFLFNLKKILFVKNINKPNPLLFSRQTIAWTFAIKLLKKMKKTLKSFKFKKRLKFFIKKSFSSIFKVVRKRIKRWHLNLILFAKPYVSYLCKIFKLKRCFFFTTISKSTITAGMIARYMVLKFLQGFKLNFVVNTVRRTIRSFLKKKHGYKICLSGRFTRKQIATYRWFKSGSITLNQRVSGIDYAHDGGTSKFGLFGIKIWIFMGSNI